MISNKKFKNIRKTKNTLLIVLLIIIVISPYISAEDINYLSTQKLIKDLNLSKDLTILKKRFQDITGDKKKDQIFLVGQRLSSSKTLYYFKIKIIVYDLCQKKFYLIPDLKFKGYEPKLELFDFTSDSIKDIFLEANTGGSGGIYNHLIITFTNDNLKVIFDESTNRGLSVEGKYLKDFKSVLEIKELDKEIVLDLNFNKKQYIKENIYNKQGEVLKEIKPYTYPFGQLKIIDYDLDNSFELQGVQRIVGAYGADTIGYLKTILKYEGDWKYKQVQISIFIKKYNFNY